MTDHPSSLAGGRFQVVRRLGAGAWGSVWLARDDNLGGRLVAVKLLLARTGPGSHNERFRREARLMAQLRHPGLIDVYDVSLTGTEFYIAQEYVEGSDLASLLARSGPLSPAAVRRLARELAETLAYLHGRGVVHRDLKPANVMIQTDGRSRLADLGLALSEDSTRLTQEGSLLGTVLYMPPEAARGEEQGPPADVFAFGLVLWEAATGRHPFGGATRIQDHILRLAMERLEPPPRPEGMAEDLYRLLTACMRTDPAERPADGAAVEAMMAAKAMAAKAMAPPSPSHSSSSSSSSPPPPRPSRRRGPLLGLLAAALALSLLAAWQGPGRGNAPALLPSPAPSPALGTPSVRCLVDAVELDLPGPPPPGTTARLVTLDGELVLQRSVREPRIRLRPPEGLAGSLRWSVTGGGATVEGEAAVGPRLLVDAGGHLAWPPVRFGGRQLLALAPTDLAVLVEAVAPGAPLALARAARHEVAARPRPGRPPLPKLHHRLRHSVAALYPVASDAVAAVPFGRPASVVRLPLNGTDPATVTARPDREVVDALTLALPGGGTVLAIDMLEDGLAGPRRRVLLTLHDDRGDAGPELSLPGRSPLGLAALDAGRLLLVHVGEEGALATLLRREGTGLTVARRWPLDLAPPVWRDEAPAVGATLAGGGAALAVGNRLVVARADGELLVGAFELGRQGGVGAILDDGPEGLTVLLNRLATEMATAGAVEAHRVRFGGEALSISPPERVRLTTERVDEVLPLGVLPSAGGGFLLYSTGLLLDCEGPPAWRWRWSRRVDAATGWLYGDDGTLFIATTTGRIYGLDLEGR